MSHSDHMETRTIRIRATASLATIDKREIAAQNGSPSPVDIARCYFDHGWTPPAFFKGGKPVAYEPSNDGKKLLSVTLHEPLTVEGELNKLAANIAIGRNWAGVHYYTDYIESMRMGEEIAIGLLEEQKLTYTENFTMTVPLFDGGAVRI